MQTGFNPDSGLFRATEDNRLYPNPSALRMVPHALELYEFLGRMLGKVLYEVRYLPAEASPLCSCVKYANRLLVASTCNQGSPPQAQPLLVMPPSKQAHSLSYLWCSMHQGEGFHLPGSTSLVASPCANLEAHLCRPGPGAVCIPLKTVTCPHCRAFWWSCLWQASS